MTKPTPDGRPPEASPPGTPETPETPDFIAENLRRMFGAVEGEELPDRFKDLLRRLAEEEGEK